MISSKKLFLGTAVLGFSLSHSISGLAQGEERPELTGTWTMHPAQVSPGHVVWKICNQY